MRYKLKQSVYVKETLVNRSGEVIQDLFIPCRIISVSRDPGYVYVRSSHGGYTYDPGKYMVEPDLTKGKAFTVKIPLDKVFTKEEVDLLYGT